MMHVHQRLETGKEVSRQPIGSLGRVRVGLGLDPAFPSPLACRFPRVLTPAREVARLQSGRGRKSRTCLIHRVPPCASQQPPS